MSLGKVLEPGSTSQSFARNVKPLKISMRETGVPSVHGRKRIYMTKRMSRFPETGRQHTLKYRPTEVGDEPTVERTVK